ncbi:hypothetical protein BpHYR1_026797 [Brachionus plicatilis]|uniref:Uncharacterized protein n=1 Tax=Brachionus plicatilis TaxID=10195 RepID=A0A3M7PII3_BRAPC|nr:hypothetical protein BpHYR1_026797 [Brachionus plicatilis]
MGAYVMPAKLTTLFFKDKPVFLGQPRIIKESKNQRKNSDLGFTIHELNNLTHPHKFSHGIFKYLCLIELVQLLVLVVQLVFWHQTCAFLCGPLLQSWPLLFV